MSEASDDEFDPLLHDLDEDGDHDEDECQPCIEKNHSVSGECRCGACCRLFVEVTVRDAVREPRIAAHGSPTLSHPDPVRGERELIGYLLNGPSGACVFLDATTNGCMIYETRPGTCRIFDCDGEGRDQLIELGMLERRQAVERTLFDDIE
jgi:Fe-S-cluster containining protein